MTLEDRLSSLLHDAAATVPTNPAGMAPEARANRRRRRRRTAGSTLTTAVVVIACLGAYRAARPNGGINVAADRQSNIPDASHAADVAGSSEPESRSQTPPVTALEATDDRAALSTYRSEVPADTGPDLEWTEVTPPRWDGGQMVWTGGQFVGTAQGPSSVDLIASVDGSEWSTVGSLPTDATSPALLVSGSSLVAWTEKDVPDALGNETSANAISTSEVFVSEVFVSDDTGRSWEGLGSLPVPAPVPSDDPAVPGYLTRSRHIVAAAVSPEASGHDTVVLATVVSNDLDVERLLADNGVDKAEDAAVGYSLDPGDLGTVWVCADLECSSEQTYTLAELGLSDEELAVATSGTGSTELWRSVSGGPLEPVPVEAPGHTISLTWAGSHFLLAATDEEQTTLTRSTDGVTWEPLALPPSDGVGSTLVATDAAVYLSSWDDLGFVSAHSSTDEGRTWGGRFDLPVAGSGLQGGPSGLVAVSALESPPLTVSKDGFTVSLANQGVLVIEEATGETVLSFDIEDLSAEEAPETVVYQEVPYQLTFLRPGTLEPMVTVTEADLGAADPHQGMPPDFVLGWSADGAGWGWQSATEAFGVAAWPSIVVGDGLVLGVVYPNAGAYDGEPETALPRMFVARTP